MVYAFDWFVYDPGTRLVHQEEGCGNSFPPGVRGFQRVGNASMATLDEAVAKARELLDREAQPCGLCRPKVEIAKPRTVYDDWLDKLDDALGRGR